MEQAVVVTSLFWMPKVGKGRFTFQAEDELVNEESDWLWSGLMIVAGREAWWFFTERTWGKFLPRSTCILGTE